MVTTTCESGIMSSIFMSAPAYSISERRASPYLSRMAISSSLMICILLGSCAKISFKSVINNIISSYSPLSLSCSSPVSWRKRISTMALAWISDNSKRAIRRSLASSGLFEPLMILITSSMLSLAMINPSKMCALASAFFSSNSVLRTMTSWRCSTK